MGDTLRVRTAPFQPHCFFYGGFDIQMHRTHEVLQAAGVDAKPLNWWARDEQFEILHAWGLHAQHQSLFSLAKRYDKKIALTPLLPYISPMAWLRHNGGRLMGRKYDVIDVLRNMDVMLVVNTPQADAAMKIFGVPAGKIEVIPTILDPLFFDDAPVPPMDGAPETYAVCAGNILPRKNQVRLAQAALKAGVSVVFIGNVMGGEQAYTAEFESLINANPTLRWHKWLSWPDLYRTLRNASAIALPSFDECQPASGLEAAALQKPLLLANLPYAKQEFYNGAMLVDPASVEEIASGLKKILADPARYTPSHELIQQCRGEIVGKKLRSIFERLAAAK